MFVHMCGTQSQVYKMSFVCHNFILKLLYNNQVDDLYISLYIHRCMDITHIATCMENRLCVVIVIHIHRVHLIWLVFKSI